MEEEIVKYLMENFLKSLVMGGSVFNNTEAKRKQCAYFWAKRRYAELSQAEKREILQKLK